MFEDGDSLKQYAFTLEHSTVNYLLEYFTTPSFSNFFQPWFDFGDEPAPCSNPTLDCNHKGNRISAVKQGVSLFHPLFPLLVCHHP